MNEGLNTRLIITPGTKISQLFRPPITPTEKLIKIFVDVTQPSKQFFFPRDKELDDSIILGMKFQPAILFRLFDPQGNQLNISDSAALRLMVTLIDQEDRKMFDSFPLIAMEGGYHYTSSASQVQFLEFVENTRLFFNKCYLRSVVGAPSFTGIVPISVIYAPKGMIRR